MKKPAYERAFLCLSSGRAQSPAMAANGQLRATWKASPVAKKAPPAW